MQTNILVNSGLTQSYANPGLTTTSATGHIGRLHTSELTPELTPGQNVQPRVVKLKVDSELTLSYQTLTLIADRWVK